LQDAEYLFEPQLSYSGDLNTVTLSISNKPDWLTFDSATGALSGSPNNAQVGIYEGIYIAATNGHHNVGLEGFSIQVINVNDTPILVDDVPNQAFTLGAPQSLSLASYFDDIDEGDELTYSATDLPAGLSLDSKGLLSGTPSSAGSFTTKITATDNSSEAVETSFTINVADNKSSGGGGGSFASLFLAFLAFTWSARRVLGK